MTEQELKCLHCAEVLHNGVTYGDGLSMLEQITHTANLVYGNTILTGEEAKTVYCAALLHKCFEPKRIVKWQLPLSEETVRRIAGDKVLAVVNELRGEPEDENKSKHDQWVEKAKWAKGLSHAAREILLAEKVINFRTSRDKPNPQKPLAWHLEYLETRMLMVEAIKDTNFALSQKAHQAKEEAETALIARAQGTHENGTASAPKTAVAPDDTVSPRKVAGQTNIAQARGKADNQNDGRA